MQNELYLVVLPLIHMNTGATEQTLTLLPNKEFATEFPTDEVGLYLGLFNSRSRYFTGGRVAGYESFTEPAGDGRVIVRVVQNVV